LISQGDADISGVLFNVHKIVGGVPDHFCLAKTPSIAIWGKLFFFGGVRWGGVMWSGSCSAPPALSHAAAHDVIIEFKQKNPRRSGFPGDNKYATYIETVRPSRV